MAVLTPTTPALGPSTALSPDGTVETTLASAPTIRSVGSVVETNTYDTNLSPGDPAGLAAGDIQVLIEVLTGFGTSPSLPTFKSLTSGWTQILDTGQVAAATGTRIARMRISWAAYDATDPVSDTNVDGSNLGGTPTATNFLHRAVRVAVTGCDTSDPIDVSGHSGGSSMAVTNAFSMSGVSTTVANTLVMGILLATDDNSFSAQAFGTSPSSLVEHLDLTSTTGGDQGLCIVTGEKASAGATGTFTATSSAPVGFEDPSLGAVIAFQPTAVSAPTGAPSFVAAGTVVETATKASGVSPGLPSGWATGDFHILLMQVTMFGGGGAGTSADVPTVNTPTGWSTIDNTVALDSSGSSTRKTRLIVARRFALASDSAPSVQMNNDGLATGSGREFLFRAVILGYRDVSTNVSSTVFGATGRSQSGTNTPTGNNLSVRVDDTRVVSVASISNDVNSSGACTGLTSVTERLDSTSATGSDGALAVIDGTSDIASSVGPAVFTLGSSDTSPTVVTSFRLEPPNTTAPAAPSGLTLTEPVSGTIRVQFTMPADLDAYQYVVRYKPGTDQTFAGITDGTQHTAQSFAPAVAGAVDVSATGFSVTTAYTIGVAAIDDAGNVSAFTTANITTGDPSSANPGDGEAPSVLQLARALVIDTAQLVLNQQATIEAAASVAEASEASRDMRLIEACARSAENVLGYVEELT